jgi:3',5'-cyclic AMP phosphodiesterase CpdA
MSVLNIAHLSDPHFGTINDGVAEGLLRSLQRIAPSLVLLTGDITQRARHSQFQGAKEFTHKLKPTPVIAVPGNHDIPLLNLPARLFYPYRGFKRLFKDQLEKDFIHGDVQVYGLNSTSRWRHIQGDFNIERIKKRFRGPPSKCKVRVVAFHHPVDCFRDTDEKNLLKGREPAMKVFSEAGIDLVLGGHIHDPFVTLSNRRYPGLARPMIVAVAGTCTSWRTRRNAPNSFNLIEINTDSDPRISIIRYDIRSDFDFVPVTENHFIKTSEGWRIN